jgi:asparagine synthase (glutamine-hydrolysing)
LKPTCQQLVGLLTESVNRNRTDALLLSGGLDSTILASILRPQYSVTAALGSDAPDIPYARQVAQKYSKTHAEVVFDEASMIDLVDTVVQVFKTFDPIEIRNSCVALAGLQRAKNDGHNKVMTGDGGDELFAGYNFLSRYHGDIQRLDQELRRLWKIMHFSSQKLAAHLAMEVKTPFLDEQFAAFAKSIDASEKIAEYNGQIWGKFVLRRCFEPELGPLVWRKKMAQEQGAGTDRFEKYIDKMIDDSTFANKKKIALSEGVRLRSKEHLNYYAIFRSYFPPPKEESKNCELHCLDCMSCVDSDTRFCRTCGSFPVKSF